MTARRLLAATAAAAAAAVAAPAPAAAHGLVSREDLPIPEWLFGWAAALVLIASFVALAVLWPTPRLQRERWRPLPGGLSRALTSRPVELGCGAAGVALLGLVVWTGLAGSDIPSDNFSPTFVYISFWLGLVPLSVVFGDVFRAFNPWRALGRAGGWLLGRLPAGPPPRPLAYPPRLGRWPAVVGLLAFGWLEIAAPNGDSPQTLAVATLVYSAATFVAMGLYGVEPWVERGEAFSVYFNLFSRLGVLERRGDRLGVRRPLSGLPGLDDLPGTVPLLATMIGMVSFDGFSASRAWTSVVLELQDPVGALGLSEARTLELIFGLGLLASVLLVYGFYRLGIEGVSTVGGGLSARRLSQAFAHSLVPIALAYTAAHYVSFLLLQGQATAPLASNPLGDGADLFGTASWSVNYAWIGGETFWYLQVGLIVLGHVCALALAHDRALALYDRAKLAVRSQYWMLAVMVVFTTLALWLLSEASKG